MSNLSNKEPDDRWRFISFLRVNEAFCMFYYLRFEISNCSVLQGRQKLHAQNWETLGYEIHNQSVFRIFFFYLSQQLFFTNGAALAVNYKQVYFLCLSLSLVSHFKALPITQKQAHILADVCDEITLTSAISMYATNISSVSRKTEKNQFWCSYSIQISRWRKSTKETLV